MRKKLMVLAMAFAMILTFAACGGGGGEEEAATTTEETATEEFNPDAAEDAMSIEELREANGEEVPVAKDLTLGIVMKSLSNEFWRTLEEGYHVGEKEAGIKVVVQATTDENDETGQQTMTSDLINQKVGALLMSPISDSNLTNVVEDAKAAGIKTVNVNDGLIANADHYVGPNAYQNGELAAEWMTEKLGGKGQVAIVIGMPKAFAARERTAGFKEWIEKNDSGLEVIAEQNADWDRQKAKELAATWIQQNPDLKGIFCNNDTMALGVVEAVKEAKADILVVGVDGIGEAYDSIRKGELNATVDSFPYYMSQVAVECTLRALAGQELPSVVATPQALIDDKNVDKDAAEIIGWKAPSYKAE